MEDCQPCGSSKCTSKTVTPKIPALVTADEMQGGLSDMTFDLIVGNVVTNCNGGNESLQSQTSGSISLTDTWSIEADIGIEFEKLLELGVIGDWSESQQTTFSQAITITVDPGQQVRLAHSINVISP